MSTVHRLLWSYILCLRMTIILWRPLMLFHTCRCLIVHLCCHFLWANILHHRYANYIQSLLLLHLLFVFYMHLNTLFGHIYVWHIIFIYLAQACELTEKMIFRPYLFLLATNRTIVWDCKHLCWIVSLLSCLWLTDLTFSLTFHY